MIWKPEYSVDVELIDEQHKELFSRLSKFIEIVQNDTPWDEKLDKIKETMEFMRKYVIIHFEDEEAYQVAIGYPDIENHRATHTKFKEEIEEYMKNFREHGFTEEKVQEFVGKLMAWLIMHVGHMDQKIGEYAKSKEVNR